jgi:hypothetical protein
MFLAAPADKSEPLTPSDEIDTSYQNAQSIPDQTGAHRDKDTFSALSEDRL